MRGARKSGGDWRIEGEGGVHVGGDLHWERRWGAGEKYRGLQRGMATDGEELIKRGEIMIQKTGEEKCGAEGIY